MHSIKLNVKDSLYTHIMYLLKNLNPQEIEVVEDINLGEHQTTKASLQKLFETKDVALFTDVTDPMLWQEEQRCDW